MKTSAAVLTQLKHPLQIMELEIPLLKKGQVLVQIAFSGICHTQLNEIKGTKGPDPYLPHTLGHEGAGVVLDIGEGVQKVKPGDSVVISWMKGAGCDVPNTIYQSDIGNVNSGAVSTFLEKAVISENRLIPIPKTIPLREAALLGCAIPTGAGVIMNEMKIQPGHSLVVFGAGGIGLSAILAASCLKASPIVAVDIHEEKLALARQFGATHTIHAPETDPLSKLHEIFQGKGADFAFECAGKKEAMETAFNCLKAPGGLCILAGNLPKGTPIQIDPFELIKGKRIVGTWGGNSRIDEDVVKYADLFLTKRNLLKDLISHVVPLLEINALIEGLSQGKIARGLVSFA